MRLISVVIPLYNKATLVERTLKSVLAQTFTDYEIIVVDDGSTDGSAEVAEAMNIPDLRLIRQQNAGVSAARNRGIEEAHGKYIALLDADDEWKPEYLETQIALTKKYPNCEVFATNYEFHDAEGKIIPTILRNLPFETQDGELTNYFKVAATSHPPICSISIMATKSAFQSVGGFPLGVKSGEDLLTWANLAVRYKIAYSKKPLAIYNQSSYDNISKSSLRFGNELFIIDKIKKIAKKYIKKQPDIGLYLIRIQQMQSLICIETGNHMLAIKISLDAVKSGGSISKFFVIIILALLPTRLAKYLLSKR